MRCAAAELHENEGTLEIDSNAVVSEGDDSGAYVQSWVWVPYDDSLKESDAWVGKFPDADWQYEVANGDTTLGLKEWREDKIRFFMEDLVEEL